MFYDFVFLSLKKMQWFVKKKQNSPLMKTRDNMKSKSVKNLENTKYKKFHRLPFSGLGKDTLKSVLLLIFLQKLRRTVCCGKMLSQNQVLNLFLLFVSIFSC